MLKLKRLIGQELYIGEGHEEITIRVESVVAKEVHLVIHASRQKGEVLELVVANEVVDIKIDDAWTNFVSLAIAAPISVRILRAELRDRDGKEQQTG
jgi:sRNA-binding carbon storage regulator CsrA